VLKARVTDTNKSVQALALDIVCRISTGMEKPFEKYARLFVLPVSTVLADQKASTRSAALQALTAIATACNGLESMVPGIVTALETTNPLQKGTLLHWLSDWFKDKELTASLELNTWVSPVISCLDDRNSDVRKGAQALLPILIACAGFDYVLLQTNSLKPASRASAVPLIQACRPSLSSALAPKAPVTTSSPSVEPVDPPSESPPSSSVPPPRPKVTGVRRKLPQGNNLPESRAETPVETVSNKGSVKPVPESQRGGAGILSAQPAPSPSLPFYGTNMDIRKTRTGKDSNRWINESGPTRKDLADLLQSQMETHASKELIARLFSHDHSAVNDHIQGLNIICEAFSSAEDESAEAVCLANFDLALKYVSIKAHEPQPNLISKCLEVVEVVLAFLRNANHQLTDGEAVCFIPTIINKASNVQNFSNLVR
jgi:cytoskeleton-associated protein 5